MKMPAGLDIARLYDEHAPPLYAYLLKFTRNEADTRDKTKEDLAAEIISPFAQTDDPDEKVFRAELAVALGTLPEEQRAVVHLKLWAGLTFEAIAAALEIPPNTAASRYRYGIDKLRGQLRPLYEEMKKAE